LYQLSTKRSKGFKRNCEEKVFFKEKAKSAASLTMIGQGSPYNMHIYTMKSFFVPNFINSLYQISLNFPKGLEGIAMRKFKGQADNSSIA
jgi:hypothetical protein